LLNIHLLLASVPRYPGHARPLPRAMHLGLAAASSLAKEKPEDRFNSTSTSLYTNRTHDVVTVIRSLVPITSMKASSLSFSIAPRPAFIEVETTVGPARARGRPRMRAVPYSDLCVSSRRSRGYEKPKRAFTGPLGSTQHRELRPAHRKRPSHRETKRASNGM